MSSIDEFFSTACRAFRFFIACIGCSLATAFVSYGAVLEASGGAESEPSGFIIVFGAFVAVQSCVIGVMNHKSEQQVRQLINAMNSQMMQLRQSNSHLQAEVNRLHDIHDRFEASNTKYRAQLKEAATNIETYKHENERLVDTLNELEKTREELARVQTLYKEGLQRVTGLHQATQAELDQIRAIAGQEHEQATRLQKLCTTQEEEIANMQRQLENLNELQRKSVNMIRQLAMYGDECKTMGVSLKEVSADLRETDSSLGLTAHEMTTQLVALQRVTEQLQIVASRRETTVD